MSHVVPYPTVRLTICHSLVEVNRINTRLFCFNCTSTVRLLDLQSGTCVSVYICSRQRMKPTGLLTEHHRWAFFALIKLNGGDDAGCDGDGCGNDDDDEEEEVMTTMMVMVNHQLM